MNLTNIEGNTTAFKVSLAWSAALFNGGSSVIDYEVSYSNVSNFSNYISSIKTNYTTVTGLVPGVIYTFYVKARNSLGYSLLSAPI